MKTLCRTCLGETNKETAPCKLDFNKQNSLSQDIRNQLEAFVPELDINLVTEAVICDNCTSLLSSFYQFRKKCLQTEEVFLGFGLTTNKHGFSIDDLVNTCSKWPPLIYEKEKENCETYIRKYFQFPFTSALMKLMILEDVFWNKYGLRRRVGVKNSSFNELQTTTLDLFLQKLKLVKHNSNFKFNHFKRDNLKAIVFGLNRNYSKCRNASVNLKATQDREHLGAIENAKKLDYNECIPAAIVMKVPNMYVKDSISSNITPVLQQTDLKTYSKTATTENKKSISNESSVIVLEEEGSNKPPCSSSAIPPTSTIVKMFKIPLKITTKSSTGTSTSSANNNPNINKEQLQTSKLNKENTSAKKPIGHPHSNILQRNEDCTPKKKNIFVKQNISLGILKGPYFKIQKSKIAPRTNAFTSSLNQNQISQKSIDINLRSTDKTSAKKPMQTINPVCKTPVSISNNQSSTRNPKVVPSSSATANPALCTNHKIDKNRSEKDDDQDVIFIELSKTNAEVTQNTNAMSNCSSELRNVSNSHKVDSVIVIDDEEFNDNEKESEVLQTFSNLSEVQIIPKKMKRMLSGLGEVQIECKKFRGTTFNSDTFLTPTKIQKNTSSKGGTLDINDINRPPTESSNYVHISPSKSPQNRCLLNKKIEHIINITSGVTELEESSQNTCVLDEESGHLITDIMGGVIDSENLLDVEAVNNTTNNKCMCEDDHSCRTNEKTLVGATLSPVKIDQVDFNTNVWRIVEPVQVQRLEVEIDGDDNPLREVELDEVDAMTDMFEELKEPVLIPEELKIDETDPVDAPEGQLSTPEEPGNDADLPMGASKGQMVKVEKPVQLIAGLNCHVKTFEEFEEQFRGFTIEELYCHQLVPMPECYVVVKSLDETELQKWSSKDDNTLLRNSKSSGRSVRIDYAIVQNGKRKAQHLRNSCNTYIRNRKKMPFCPLKNNAQVNRCLKYVKNGNFRGSIWRRRTTISKPVLTQNIRQILFEHNYCVKKGN